MKILLFDIETAPSTAYIWGLYNEVTSMEMVENEWYTLCWGAKWFGEKKIMSSSLPEFSLYKKDKTNDSLVVKELWKLLDEADVVIAHNAVKFDVKKINTRFIMSGLTPPSPYKTLDTLLVARKYFSFMSNRLNDLGVFLKVGKKVDTGGFKLWKGCMEGCPKSWKHMVRYCKKDVELLEKVYIKMLPYIKTHPNRTAYNDGRGCCPKCGKETLIKSKKRQTLTGMVQQYYCNGCGGFSTQKIRSLTKEEKSGIYKNA